MSKRELDRLSIIERYIIKEVQRKKAADLLKLSQRQVSRLKVKVLKHGARGLVHGNRGKPGHARIPEKERERIIKFLRQKDHHDFKPGFAAEKLNEKHNIVRDPKTICAIMIDEGLWQPKKAKVKEKHRTQRPRKEHFGEMIQFDGSYHPWFENRGPVSCLLASIDDATSAIVKLTFAPHEGVFPVFDFWREYVLHVGKPRAIYVDMFSTYTMTQKVARENHDTKTQFERAMSSLNIEPISAHSSEAKGRVERLFDTLQDRLIKEMRLAGISSITDANRFVEEDFIPKHNARFAVVPQKMTNLHVPLKKDEKNHLDSIFSRQEERTVNNDYTISFQNTWYQITKDQQVTVGKKNKVTVCQYLDGSIHIQLRDKDLNHRVLPKRPKKLKNVPWIIAASPHTKKTTKQGKKRDILISLDR